MGVPIKRYDTVSIKDLSLDDRGFISAFEKDEMNDLIVQMNKYGTGCLRHFSQLLMTRSILRANKGTTVASTEFISGELADDNAKRIFDEADKLGHFLINLSPRFKQNFDFTERVFILFHEIGHHILRHMTKEHFSYVDKYEDKEFDKKFLRNLQNITDDGYLNEFILSWSADLYMPRGIGGITFASLYKQYNFVKKDTGKKLTAEDVLEYFGRENEIFDHAFESVKRERLLNKKLDVDISDVEKEIEEEKKKKKPKKEKTQEDALQEIAFFIMTANTIVNQIPVILGVFDKKTFTKESAERVIKENTEISLTFEKLFEYEELVRKSVQKDYNNFMDSLTMVMKNLEGVLKEPEKYKNQFDEIMKTFNEFKITFETKIYEARDNTLVRFLKNTKKVTFFENVLYMLDHNSGNDLETENKDYHQIIYELLELYNNKNDDNESDEEQEGTPEEREGTPEEREGTPEEREGTPEEREKERRKKREVGEVGRPVVKDSREDVLKSLRELDRLLN